MGWLSNKRRQEGGKGMAFFSQVLLITRIEARLFMRFPKLLVASIVVALIPALYTVIYLSSVWDPDSHTHALAVALVNLDQDVEYRGQTFNVGKEVVARLKARHSFGFREGNNETAVRQAVREGKLAFALIIPSDFSSHAVPGARQGAGRLVVYTSEGNNYQSAHLARRFAEDLGHAVNDSLNERRWDLVITTAAGSKRSVERLRQGVSELQSGARALETGTAQTADGARAVHAAAKAVDSGTDEFTAAVGQLANGLRALDAARPKPADLHRLQDGGEALATGQLEIDQGLTALQLGAKRMVDEIDGFRAEAQNSVFIPSRVVDGLHELQSGASQLDAGLLSATAEQHKLTEGAKALSNGLTTMTSAVQAMGNGIHSMASRLPDDQTVKSLTAGTNLLQTGSATLADGTLKVKAGAQRLAVGVEVLLETLPASLQTIDGSAKGMAQSVQPQVEVDAPVQNQGSSFAPNVIAAALWLGASIIAFLINVRVLPDQATAFSRPAQCIGKIVVPSLIVVLQALSVLLAVSVVLGIQVLHLGPLIATLVIAALTFLCMVFAMTRALGDAGKALAMLFLAVQLSSSGGVLPVELSGNLFANISPWLPMTWLVKALKASLFGAYDDAWQQPLQLIAWVGLGATVCATFWGTWRYASPDDMRPAVDF